jgi:hypothetical protein
MTLPEVCPLDESQICKEQECHLFCLEWRTKEPTCLIGYSTTSKTRSGKAGRNKDTYAEETFRKLGRQSPSKRRKISENGDWTPTRLTENPPVRSPEKSQVRSPPSKRRKISENGDWIPTRLTEKPPVSNPEKSQVRSPERPIEMKEESFTQSLDFQEATIRALDPKPERNHDERLRERYATNDIEKAPIRLESSLKKEAIEQNSVIYAEIQPKIHEKPRTRERVISRDKHTTIFTALDADKKDNSRLSGREEKTKRALQDREKRKKLDEVMKIDLPDTHDEFWS